MASNLRVDTILPSSGTTLGIGTANGTINFLGNSNLTTSGDVTIGGDLGVGGTVTYEDVARIDIEKGGVSAEILIEYKGRMQRIKTDKERARLICVQARNGLALYKGCKDYQEYEKRVPSVLGDGTIDKIVPSVFAASIDAVPKITDEDQMIIAEEELETEGPIHIKTVAIQTKLLQLEASIAAHREDTEKKIKEIKDLLEDL